jgi:histidine triad (HIT) family protein
MALPYDGDCVFCRMASGEIRPHIICEDSDVLAFLDAGPIREGHTQVIPRAHFRYFDDLPAEPMMRVAALAQRIAKVQKQLYGVERESLVITGGGIPHVHAHVVPMAGKTDITSRRYIAGTDLTFRPLPSPSHDGQANTAAKLRDAPGLDLR